MDGALVLVQGDHRLYGKIVGLHGGGYDVEHFLSVAARQMGRYRKSDLVHARLPKQTRVFYRTPTGNWRVGRVRDVIQEDDKYFRYDVRFPNGVDLDLHERDLHVRSLDEFADPADILAAGCAETQYFADRRRRAVGRLGSLRSASQGLTGLLSSAIEFVPHQIAAVRRVLTDPLQRYLLADEVGLGKTIEAGVIIRQLLLDGAVRRAAILVPEKLVDQWKVELSSKFLGGELARSDVDIRSHADVAMIDPNDLDLLVVDEAHKVVAISISDQTESSERIKSLALSTPRLLLLSATPALADESRFLAMLNLLDPAAFPLDQPEAFREKVAKRQEIGRFLLAFRPGVHSFVLKQQTTKALELFKGDDEVVRIVDAFRDAAASGSVVDTVVNELRDHVARTYRIHQRMIRARRSDIDGWAMWPRGPKVEGGAPSLRHVRLEFDDDDRNLLVAIGLDAWRDAAIRARESNPSLWQSLGRRALDLHTRAGAGADVLARFSASLEPLFAAEVEILENFGALQQTSAEPSRRHFLIAQALRDWKREQVAQTPGKPPQKICCFCSDSEDAVGLSRYLQAVIGAGFVASLVGPQSRPDIVRKFEQDRAQWVMVCDGEAEEGVNLQFAHTIFHADLPLSAARLEQRIGRLDRFGRRVNGVSHRVFLPVSDDESPWSEWFSLLANGFLIFNQSVSDVQFLLESQEAKIAEALLEDGATGIASLVESVLEEISNERLRLDEQYALDSLSLMQETGSEIAKEIESSEDDEEAIGRDLLPWIARVLALHHSTHEEGPDLFRLSWTDDTLLPATPWKRLFSPAIDKPSTWKRHRALKNSAHIELVRPGSTLVNALERVARWDDRGIAYSTWRVDPDWESIWRGFRLIWVVEPDCLESGPIYRPESDPSFRRQAEGFLRQTRFEQVFDEGLSSVTDPIILAAVKRSYSPQGDASGRKDINLGSRPEDLQHEIDAVVFSRLVGEVKAQGIAQLTSDPEFEELHSKALFRCRQEATKVRASLVQRARMYRLEQGAEANWIKSEEARLSMLEAAIAHPRIRLDEIGFLVLSATSPRLDSVI